MFQIVVQLAMRQLEANLKLPAPAFNRAEEKHRKKR